MTPAQPSPQSEAPRDAVAAYIAAENEYIRIVNLTNGNSGAGPLAIQAAARVIEQYAAKRCEEAVKELLADKARLDWLEQRMRDSSYPVILRGLTIRQSNGTIMETGVDSGPFHKVYKGPSGPNPLRNVIDAARARDGKEG